MSSHNPEHDPDTVVCPECGEDRWNTADACERCGHVWEKP